MNITLPRRKSLESISDINLLLNHQKIPSNIQENGTIYRRIQIKNAYKLNNKTKQILNRNDNINILKKNDKYISRTKVNNKIRLIKSKYFQNEILIQRVNSPLKREYKTLKSYIPNSQRYFKYLSNSDLDSIFKYNNNSNQNGIFYEKEIKVLTNPKRIFDYKNRRKNVNKNNEEEKDFRDIQKTIFIRLSKNPSTNNTNNIILKQKKEKINKNCLRRNIFYDFNSVNKNKIKLVDKSKQYLNFTSLLKNYSKKNAQLLLNIKKEETINKNSLLSSLAKFNIIKSRIKLKSHY